jgi:hypothetical protein
MAFGISVDDLIKMSPEEAFQAVAKGALSIADASQRAAALTQVFGQRVARFLIPALAELAKGADANIEAMKAQGRVMDKELLDRADAARDKLGQAWDKLIANAAPAVTAIIEVMNGLIGFGNTLGEQIADAIWGPTVKMSAEQRERIFNALGGKSGMTGLNPGSAQVSNAGIESFPDHIDVTPSKLAAAIKVLEALEEFAKDAQAAMDEADQNIAESQQELVDQITDLWDGFDQKFAEDQQALADKITEIWDDYYQREAEANQQTIDEISDRWNDYYQRQAEEQQQLKDRITDIGRDFVDDLAGLLVEGGNHWKDYARVAIRAIEQIIRAQEQFDRSSGAEVGLGTILRAFGLGSSSSASSFPESIAVTPQVFGSGVPGRAGGGHVSAGNLYRVNERHSEFFKPDVSGTVIPLASRIPSIPRVNASAQPIHLSISNHISLDGANGDEALQRMATQAVQVATARSVSIISKNLPGMMVKAQRDKL